MVNSAAQEEDEVPGPLRLYLSSLKSDYTRKSYKVYLDKYLKITGYKDVNELLGRQPKEIESELIEFIISLKESGSKFSTISNYVQPILGLCKISDIVLNQWKVNKYIPSYVRNRKTREYKVHEIQAMLDIAKERERCICLLLSSSGLRINGLCGLTIGSLTEVGDGEIYQICVYENDVEWEYVTFCTTEAKRSLLTYLNMRKMLGEDVTNPLHPLIRQEFNKRDPFAAAHPKPVTATSMSYILRELAQAAGIRTRTQLESGQKGPSQRKEVPLTNGFRRYFSTTLVNAGVPDVHRWLMEGHKLLRNDPSYVYPTPETLYKSYMQAHDDLLIDQSHKLRQEIQKLEIEKSKFDILSNELDQIKKAMRLT
jgi:site-specific recombinase XerD